ncbi:AAA family ATPase [Desulfospira joergensenii]|uniref:AAA family ATPase n=1 Tax=Desulfospira joergensenii TaxID=53329 RepID=UPI0004033ADC|nr:AAA family ATPase [Desulfospira joergensenii]
MKILSEYQAQDPKKIEKELGEFLNKKFGGNVRIISPSIQPQKAPVSGKSPSKGKNQLIDFDIKPAELIAHLDQYVVRQDKAKSVLSTKICTHFNRIRHAQTGGEGHPRLTGNIKSNILMLGPTGIGKTYLIRLIAKKIGVPFVKADATKFSETGYVGGDVEDLIRDLVKEADDDIELAQCGIVYIDEIDKIASSPSVIGAQISRTGVQRALLKPMEETDVDLKVPHDPVSMMQELDFFQKTGQRSKRRINTANILFILSGAFSGLSDVVRQRLTRQSIGFGSKLAQARDEIDLLKQTRAEDLVKFGFESEFIGRVPVRCVLDTLEEKDLYAILKMPNNPVILNKRLDFSAYGIDIVFSDNALKELAKRAFQENTGARGLVSVVEDALIEFEEKLPSTHIRHLTVNKEVLSSPASILEKVISNENKEQLEMDFQRTCQNFKTYITDYLRENWKVLSLRHGLTLSETRCEMVAQYFTTRVMEIETAVKQVKKFHDSVKEMELEVSKSHDLNLVFEEDAVDFLIQQFIDHNATSEEILKTIYDSFYDGFNLIREKAGKNRFFLSKKALLDHESYLNDLIRKEIK